MRMVPVVRPQSSRRLCWANSRQQTSAETGKRSDREPAGRSRKRFQSCNSWNLHLLKMLLETVRRVWMNMITTQAASGGNFMLSKPWTSALKICLLSLSELWLCSSSDLWGCSSWWPPSGSAVGCRKPDLSLWWGWRRRSLQGCGRLVCGGCRISDSRGGRRQQLWRLKPRSRYTEQQRWRERPNHTACPITNRWSPTRSDREGSHKITGTCKCCRCEVYSLRLWQSELLSCMKPALPDSVKKTMIHC